MRTMPSTKKRSSKTVYKGSRGERYISEDRWEEGCALAMIHGSLPAGPKRSSLAP